MFKLSLQKQIPLTFIIALILLVIIGYFTYRSSESVRIALEAKTHTQQILETLDETLILLLSAETAGRGFQLTSNDTFLNSVKVAQEQLPARLAELRRLFANNPAQLEKLARLESKANEKLLFVRQNIEIRRTQGLNAVIISLNSGRGRVLMDEFRAINNEIKGEETKLLKESEVELNSNIEGTTRMLLISTLAGIVSLGLANFAVFRGVKDKRIVEEKLIETNRNLENRVAERTVELQSKNAELASQVEISKLLETKRNAAIKAGNLGMWTLTPDGEFAEMDEASAQMFGLSPQELNGNSRKFFSRIEKSDFQNLEKVFRGSLAKKSGFGGEFRVNQPNGEIRWLQCTSQPQIDDEGNIKDFVGFCRDITESKNYENQLRQSETFVRDVLDSLSAHLAVVDREGNIVEVNEAWQKFAGSNCISEEAGASHIGQNYFKVSENAVQTDETTRIIIEKLREVLNGNSDGFTIEYPCDSPTEERWFLMQVTSLHSENGGAVVSHIDITDRKKAENKLKISEEFNRSIFENSPDAIHILDLDATILDINKRGQELIEIEKPQEYLGKNWIDFWENSKKEEALQVIKNASQGKTAIIEGFRRTLKGKSKYWSVSVAPVFDNQGNLFRLVSNSRDITEKQKADQALKESQNRLALALESGRAGTFEWDIVNNKNTWSPELERMYGVPVGTFEGNYEAWVRMVEPEDIEIFTKGLNECLENRENDYHYEFRVILPDGKRRWLAGRARFEYDENKKPSRMIGINIDINDIKQAQAERQKLLEREQEARREAEVANRMRDEFLATVSHELRAPLNSILGWAKIMQQGKLDETMRQKAVDTIVRNAAAQNRLIEDLLDVSRIISGKLRLEVMTIQPSVFVESALESVRPAAEAKGISLEFQEDTQLSHIAGDPNRLQQVVWNLLSNAIKFTPNGGSVRTEIERTKDSVEIRVRDTGVGIKEEFLPHVFDRFSQADASSIRKFGGLGLGLAIVRHITEMHGGTVAVESAGENQGTTFIVKLPLKIATDSAEDGQGTLLVTDKEGVPLDLSLDGLLILAVDDEADSRQMLVQALTHYGATVIAASSVGEALNELALKKPDIIVSDIGMPDEDGYSLIRKIRTMEGDKANIPAVALTAFARAQDRVRALAAGFQSHVAKPVELDELVTVIAGLKGRLYIS